MRWRRFKFWLWKKTHPVAWAERQESRKKIEAALREVFPPSDPRENFLTLLGDAMQYNRDIEIEWAQGFGRAYIEEKHQIPFDEWVKKRKQNRGSEE